MPPPGRTLQVFPDARRRQAALRTAQASSVLVRGEDFLSWDELLHVLGGARELGRRPCSPVMARVLVATLAQASGPSAFRDFVHEPAFARAGLELLLDLKAGRLSPRELQEALEAALPPERQLRARELARLYLAYEQRMAELALADREDVLRGASEALAHQAWPPAWEDVDSLVLHGVYDVRPSTLELLLKLAQACEARQVALRVETPVGGSPVADAALAALFRAFERGGESFTHVELFKADLTFEQRPLSALGGQLFSPRAPRGSLSGEVQGLSLWSATTERDEVRLVAREVRRLVSRGVAPARIAVAWREPGSEVHPLAEALDELGVPARVPWSEPLAVAGPVRLALDLPLLVEDGFPAERVAELVASRYAPTLSRGAPEAPATLLALAAVRDDRLGAREGRGAYEVRLEALARRLAASAAESGGARLRAHAVRVLRERCQRLFEACRRIPEQGSAAELLSAWWHAVRALGLTDTEARAERAEEGGLEALALGARARDEAARAALVQWVHGLERALAQVGGGPRLRRRTFGRWLLDGLRDVHLPPRGPSSAAVEVLDIRELEGRTFSHVFLAGLVEGRFPGREESNPLLGESDRLALNVHLKRDVFRLGGGDYGEQVPWRLAEDRLLFASALVAAEEGVSLSFARQGAGRQEQAPSTFLEEVQRLTGLACEARVLQPIVPLDKVLTEAELRQRVALEALAPVRLRISSPDPARGLLRQRFEREEWFADVQELAGVEYERLGFFSNPGREPGRYTGVVDGPGVQAALREAFRFDAERPLSASALKRLANCGFQGFLSYGLRVAEPEEPGEDFDARGRGIFWHRLMEKLFQKLQELGLLGKPSSEVPEKLLEEVVEAVRREFEARHHVGHHRLWELARRQAKTLARRILDTEHHGLPFKGHVPRDFELPFGPQQGSEGWRGVTLRLGEGTLHFEGKIDRVDAGGNDVSVIDYKSRVSSKEINKLREGLLESDFQLPLYLYAARASGHPQARNAAWFSLRTGEFVPLSTVMDPDKLDSLLSTEPAVREQLSPRENLANAVEQLVNKVWTGQFPIRPKDCDHCSYRSVCRITERRMVEERAQE